MAAKKRNTPKSPSPKSPQKPSPPKGLRLNLSTKVKEEVLGLVVMALCVLFMLAISTHRAQEQPGTIMDLWRANRLQNMLGPVGAYLSHLLAACTFGYAALAFPVLGFVYGWLIFTHRSIFVVNQFAFYILTLMLLVSVWSALPMTLRGEDNWEYSGLVGGMIAHNLYQWMKVGGVILWVALSIVWFIVVTRISIADLVPAVREIFLTGFRKTTSAVGRFKHRQERLRGESAELEPTANDVEEAKTPLVPQYLQDGNKNQPLSDARTSVEDTEELTERHEASLTAEQDKRKDLEKEDSSFDTALIRDMEVLGRIDKQFVPPEIVLPETGETGLAEGNEGDQRETLKKKDLEEVAPGGLDLATVNLKDLAKDSFDKEHASLDLKTRREDLEEEETRGSEVEDEEKPAEAVPPLQVLFDKEEIPEGEPLKRTKASRADEPKEQDEDWDRLNQAARRSYRVPQLDLLDATKEAEKLSEEDIAILDSKINQIISTLGQFGINTKVVATEYGGPVVAIYQLELPSGLKISRVTGLEDELALAMKVKSVRMVPVTAKGTIQVEIPKPRPTPVLIRSLFEDKAFKNARQKYRLGLALGKTIDGTIHIEDLSRMPHLLIAGTTGSGKSVGVNSMITSLLYQYDPSDVKFVLIDPKKVELALYRNLKNHHLICLCNDAGEILEDVITRPEYAKLMLRALVEEMEERYEKLAHANVRNIEDYNRRWQEGKLPEDGKHDHHKLEYIVAIIDELADLMMTSPREVETSITRLAQMARAVGIHLVVATQRPSVDVLTGLIKANFPARIAYQVRSKVDSRTILDMGGAELLLGKGDMLYLPPGQMPIRIQNAFTSTRETEEIVDYISRMPAFPRKSFVVKEEPREELDRDAEAGAHDALFNEALEIVVRHNQGSASLLQRRLSIGYARAARIIDQLERAGVVSAQEGGRPRQVLITEDQVVMFRV